MAPGESPAPAAGLTRADLVAGLQRLGLRRGDALEVHSSLSSLGWVEGGAETVIAALIETVGREGAIVMSAYPVSRALPLTDEDVARGIEWKVRLLVRDSDEPTGMGLIADTFRRRPDVVLGRGGHPVCAWGRDAHLHSRGYGRLLAMNGWALLIGVDIHRCSSMHYAEGRVRLPEAVAQIFRVPEEVLQDYREDAWAVGCGSAPEDAWQKVADEAERRGLVHRGHVGRAECLLFRAGDVVGIYEALLRNDACGLYGIARG